MIFKTLFTPAYKSTDINKRLSSIANLDPSNEKQKTILHELAFNDASDKVAFAALEKLNSFILWVKTAETSASIWLKKQAQKVVYEQLEDPTIADDNWFSMHLSESKNKIMLEHMLFNSKRLQQLPELSMSVLKTLDNEPTLKRFFTEKASTDQQIAIVNNTDDIKLLQRFKKSAKNSEVANSIDTKLAHFEWIQAQPAKIKQQVVLINARMLALKDAQDYAYIEREFYALNTEFEKAKGQFQYLDELTSASFTEKYLSLKVSVQTKLKGLEVEHNKQLALQATTNELSQIEDSVKQMQQQLDLLLASPDSSADAQVKILTSAVQSAKDEFDLVSTQAQSAAHRALVKRLQEQMTNISNHLSNIPVTLALVEEAKQLIHGMRESAKVFTEKVSLSAQELHTFAQDTKQHKQAFNDLQSQSALSLPNAIISEFKALLNENNKVMKAYQEQNKKQQARIQGKIKVVNRLIQEGKFKAAIGTFHHVDLAMHALEQSASLRIKSAFETCKLEVEKLQDWQAYIAQPRKPALLEETQVLLSQKIDDYYARAEKVKALRQQWSSLGILHTEEDNTINKAFDDALEQAFAPCRVFFAELEKTRHSNYEKALSLIETVNGVSDETVSSELIAIVDSFRKQFNAIGDMDKSKARSIKRKFNLALKPLQVRVNDWYAQNALHKEKLVKKAYELANADEPKEAAQEAKILQRKWKEIGFAGKNQENQLWQAFREHNDALFAKYHEALTVQQSEQTDAIIAIEAQVQSLADKIQAVSKPSELSFYTQSHSDLEQSLAQLDSKTAKRVLPKLNAVETQYAKTMKDLGAQKQRDDLQSLFDFLGSYDNTAQLENVAELPSRYRPWLKSELRVHEYLQGLNRAELAIVAAILHDYDTNDFNDAASRSRRELQLALMAHKLEGKDVLLPEAVLAAFVALGPLQKNDSDSLKLMNTIYMGALDAA